MIAPRTSIRGIVLAWFTAVALVTAGGWTNAPSAPRREPDYARVLRPKLQALLDETLAPAAVVLVRSPKLGNWSAGFGARTAGGGEPVGVDDHFRIGSNTKTMTGTVVLQLVQEGKLRLDDPVAKYLAGVPNGENITIAQLLNMRSGLFNYTETAEWIRGVDATPERAWTPEELLAIAFANRPYFPPGEGFHYSNTNTVLEGLIIEKVTGEPLETEFEKRIFKPLGLKDTLLPRRSSSAIPNPHPQGYRFGTFEESRTNRGVLPPDQQAAAKAGTLKPNDVTNTNPSFAWAAGGVISTANDLARYVEALVGGGLLNKKMQRQRLDSLQPISADEPAGYR